MKIFITGTDTDVGKTHVSAAILAGQLQQKKNVAYWKPLQTGGSRVDAKAVERLLGSSLGHLKPGSYKEFPEFASYLLPASPDQAAAAEQKDFINFPDLQMAATKVLDHSDPAKDRQLVVEGAGGLLVPFGRGKTGVKTWLDFLETWDDWILVVARTGLGTLNHSFLTLKTLADRGHKKIALVLSGEKHLGNEQSVDACLQEICGLQVPWFHFPQTHGSEDFFRISKDLAAWLVKIKSAADKKRDSDLLNAKEKDVTHCWHPYTQHKAYLNHADRPMFVTGAKGSRLEVDGYGWVEDGIGSWWSSLIGHGRPEIACAITQQQASLDHVLFANTAHDPAAKLAGKILEFAAQPQLKKVFYSDNGSTAVEVAMKMAYQFRRRSGFKKAHKFLSLNGSYHGDTIGTMAVGGSKEFHADFEPLLFKPLLLNPLFTGGSSSDLGVTEGLALDQLLDVHAEEIAGLIVEPLVQGAAGMKMHDAAWLKLLCEKARKKKIPVIFDEVFTGMGRLGTALAASRLGFQPDLVCLAKGLTASAASMALTLATGDIYNCFQGDDLSSAFLHGHTFTGHPVACAAGLACLDIYKKEKLLEKSMFLEEAYSEWKQKSLRSAYVQNIRFMGSILAFELNVENSSGYYWKPEEKKKFMDTALRNGVFLRPLGNTVYLSPPLNIDAASVLSRLDATIKDYFLANT